MSEPQANMHILFILVDIHQPIHVLTSVNVKQIAYLRKNTMLAVATFKYPKMLQISFYIRKIFSGRGHIPLPKPLPLLDAFSVSESPSATFVGLSQ